MKFFLLPSGVYPGKLNMEVDSRIADQCGKDEVYLRFYGWNPYCISIGRNQYLGDVNLALAARDNIEIVKRPTGGRAILHAEEVTYSFVISESFGLSRNEIYILVSKAIINGMRKYDPLLKGVMLNDTQPDFSKLYKTSQGAICFAAAAKSEVKFENKKLVGSAQRELKNSVLQHGSILWGSYHEKLPNYLNIGQSEKEKFINDLKNKTANLNSILSKKVEINRLIEYIIEGFKFELSEKFKKLKLIQKDFNFTSNFST